MDIFSNLRNIFVKDLECNREDIKEFCFTEEIYCEDLCSSIFIEFDKLLHLIESDKFYNIDEKIDFELYSSLFLLGKEKYTDLYFTITPYFLSLYWIQICGYLLQEKYSHIHGRVNLLINKFKFTRSNSKICLSLKISDTD